MLFGARRDPGAPHHARRHRVGPGAARRRRQTKIQPERCDSADRGGGTGVIEISGLDGALRRRHPDRRHDRSRRRRHERADRSQRCRQDHVLQRPQRIRPAAGGNRHRLRGRPVGDAGVPAGPVGGAAHVPDRAGRGRPVGVRERVADRGAVEPPLVDAPRGRDRRRRVRRPRPQDPPARSARSEQPSAGSSRSPVRSSANRGLVLLDEPAAGLPDEETAVLGNIIRQIPERTGAMVVLVDHDMELVSATCGQVAVLDFGRVIANGPTARGAGRPARDPGLSRRRRERPGMTDRRTPI